MAETPRIALIVGSTRDSRFAEKPVAWLKGVAAERDDLTLDILDIRDFDLPFFNEPASQLWMPSSDANAVRWQEALEPYDGFVFQVAEYNHSITGALKNALDQAYTPWVRKPMTALAYGGNGGARAVEHLRTIASELQMAPIRFATHIGGGEFMKVHPLGENAEMSAIDAVLRPSATAMFDDLVWWANALKAARG
ncbi:NADPH-dependent FMN reductase [Pseudoroseicyclus aestuarii]|uniref:NAD(P)H-dependent FMN reductase n=1 Tax=Pseudoroseicyclus aestuarii TaxID=1795041 RepID=A0A318SQ77_9RHOB|nr:NAD(P)H-dependent oxidoreductase [Pseudoroseicyclus aestuarii]PYE82508.1 NAD(P)H-dependent FMN reductase [Pseudoroseicyclus aestuarii]